VRAGEPSQTARRVAAQRRSFDRSTAGYGDPVADQLLQDDVAGELPHLDTPLTGYLAARTRFFDAAVLDAIAGGCRQVVTVGAGYDGRSLRYGHPDVRWFEVDHPATQADKSARLHRLGVDTHGVTFVAADFVVDDVAAALASAGQDADLWSLLICEGVTPYLPTEVLHGLLTALHSRAAPATILVIDFALIPESRETRRARAALQAAVEADGEPFRSEVARGDVPGLLRGCGWMLVRGVDPAGIDLAASPSATVFVTASAER
jgi:methyltransferase (TIGR00027 family)